MFVSELEKAFTPLFKKYFDLFQNAVDLNVQFGEQVELILDKLKSEISVKVLCQTIRKAEDSVKTQLYLFASQQAKERKEDLERIKADIKKEHKQAKRVIINKKNQVIAELRKNILNHICNGEDNHFNAIIHQIKKIVVYDLVFWERHIENLKVEVRKDFRMSFRNELQNMKKDLKAELLQELREEARVCFTKVFPEPNFFTKPKRCEIS